MEYSGENWQIIRHTFAFERLESLLLAGEGGAEFSLGGRVSPTIEVLVVLFYSAVHNSGATLQNCPFCKFQVEFMICALIVYGQVIYFCKGFATRILLKKIFFLK